MKGIRKASFVTVTALSLFLLCSYGNQANASSLQPEDSPASDNLESSEDMTRFDQRTSPFSSVFYGYRKPANFSCRYSENQTFKIKDGYLGSFGVENRTDILGERLTLMCSKKIAGAPVGQTKF